MTLIITEADRKRAMRVDAFARRDVIAADRREAASAEIARLVLALPELDGIAPVGSYWPMRSEVDTRPLLAALHGRGQETALSQIRHPHLSWRRWRPGDILVHGGFKVLEPGPYATEVFPRALLVPLAAFDRAGNRLGYGKGHFDRTVAALSARGTLLVVGLAFAAQEVEAVPAERHDRPLDLVVTDAGLIRPVHPPTGAT